MRPGAMVEGEACLDEVAGDVAGQWRQRVGVGEPVAVGVGQTRDGVGQFGVLGGARSGPTSGGHRSGG